MTTLIKQVIEFAQTHPSDYFTIEDLLKEFPERSRPTLAGCIATGKERNLIEVVQRGHRHAKAQYCHIDNIPIENVTKHNNGDKKIMAQIDPDTGDLILTKAQLATGIEHLFKNYIEQIAAFKKELQSMHELERRVTNVQNINCKLKDQIVILNRKINHDIKDKHSNVAISNFVIEPLGAK